MPNDARGDTELHIDDHGKRIKSQGRFTVVIGPVISSFAPVSGPTGTRVLISGSRFSPNVKVWFGALACPITGKSPTQIELTIPAGAKGRENFVVEDSGARVKSEVAFEVTQDTPPTPPEPGHGEHEHPHQHPHKAGDHHHHEHNHPHRPGQTHHHPY